jgi:hypothetical protein
VLSVQTVLAKDENHLQHPGNFRKEFFKTKVLERYFVEQNGMRRFCDIRLIRKDVDWFNRLCFFTKDSLLENSLTAFCCQKTLYGNILHRIHGTYYWIPSFTAYPNNPGSLSYKVFKRVIRIST